MHSQITHKIYQPEKKNIHVLQMETISNKANMHNQKKIKR